MVFRWEHQLTNVTSLTTKEKLQIENEELIALNGQLQEMLEHQRSSSNELQSILYSTNVATLVLDADLRILFFTPATKPLFNLIPSDVGRPLTDLSLLAADRTLQADVRTVLTTLEPVEQEIETQNGAWYIRRVLPYRALDNRVEGVVLLFVDITERRRAAQMLEAARQAAELATHAKSRFLAAASHDLRQPLQTLSLMRGVLAQNIRDKKNDEALKLIARLDQTTAVMTGMLNTLLDINRLDSGGIRVEKIRFPINDLLDRLRDEFTYHAQTQMLTLRVVSSSVSIDSDPRLLELMIRNLLSNALKYTAQGKVLLGCRRHNGILSIEIRDTGSGSPKTSFLRFSTNIIGSTILSAGEAVALASVSPLCDDWEIYWAIGFGLVRSWGRARSSSSRSCCQRVERRCSLNAIDLR